MVAEVIDGLAVDPAGLYVDATFGGGGHSAALLDRLGPAGQVVACDADSECAPRAAALADARLRFVHGNFAGLDMHVEPASVAGVVMDLGVSMLQLADPERGLSLREAGPLDMRLDRTSGRPLRDLLHRVPERTLGKVIREYGEERHWRAIAARIIRRRHERRLATTLDLAACVPGGGHGRIHPATRTFQALRIWVNAELDRLTAGLTAATAALRPGGRLVVISFHSLEDRIVKRFLRPGTGIDGPLQPVGRLQRPAATEVAGNRAARSARLRVGMKPC